MNYIKFFRRKIYWFIIKVERIKLIGILLFILTIGILITTVLIHSDVFLIDSPDAITQVFLLLIIGALLIAYKTLALTSLENDFELDARMKLIRNLIGTEYPEYENEYWYEKHIIKKNGNGRYERRVKINYSSSNISWYQISLSTTNDLPSSCRVSTRAYDEQTGRRLPGVSYGLGQTQYRSIVILDPPLSEYNPSVELKIDVDWPFVWKDIVTDRIDTGKFTVNNKTKKMILEIYPPKGYKLVGFILESEYDTRKYITYPNNGIKCELNDPQFGIYKYLLRMDVAE